MDLSVLIQPRKCSLRVRYRTRVSTNLECLLINWDDGQRDTNAETNEPRDCGTQHPQRRQEDKTRGARVARGGEKERERERTYHVANSGLRASTVELTERAAPAVERTGLDLLRIPTGCVHLVCQAAHVSYRLNTQPGHHHE